MIVLPKTLKGHIVLFHLYSNDNTPMDGNHVIQVSEISPLWYQKEFVFGRFIASELIGENEPGTLSLTNNRVVDLSDFPLSGVRIWKALITNYEILTVRDLPLLIGYRYTSPLLAKLIKGEI